MQNHYDYIDKYLDYLDKHLDYLIRNALKQTRIDLCWKI